MTSHKRQEEILRALCAMPHPDDGVNPRDEKRQNNDAEDKTSRKLRQLCKQVARTLQLAVASLPQNDALAYAAVQHVVPAPNAGRLCVVVVVPAQTQQAEAEASLAQHSGRLRAEVAAAITRRRAPELTYVVIVQGDLDE